MAETWRATEKAHRRARYLSSAARLFADHGFNGVSIDDLGGAAGVSGPALYRHFASKDAVLRELLIDASERLNAGCAATLARSGSSTDTLRALVEFHLDFALTERDVIRIQDRELASLPADTNHTIRALQRTYVDTWSRVVAAVRPDYPETDVQIRVLAVFGLLNSTPFSARDDDLERARALLADMAVLSLIGPSVADTHAAR